MSANNKKKAFAIIAVGAAAGWLCGLSLSPIANVVVASVLGLGGTMISALSGLEPSAVKDEDDAPRLRRQITPVPIALFAVSLAVIATVGIVVRNADWLALQRPRSASASDDLEARIKGWNRELEAWIAMGAPKGDVLRTMLAGRQDVSRAAQVLKIEQASDNQSPKAGSGGLYGSISPEQCHAMTGQTPGTIQALMMSKDGELADRIAKSGLSKDDLLVVGRALCGNP
ncbi:hypothetical protein [Rhizobium leguminosarum]|uniref:hypothetical protein n=1 Tax=Rhizobium leguminosarum TaxID=384 RepID=UPI0013E08544|nr:hypothetical protein [Rhizobium leguminosarum]MBY5487111.1 hypothetical protein [Rhizobium leguminosarum]